jgi:hypothetical protein
VSDDDDEDLVLFASELATGEPDPRQEQFLATVQTMRTEGYTPISMQGFRASHVDLGWIQDEIDDYVSSMPGVEAKDIVERIDQELRHVVQRLKSWSIDTSEWPQTLKLSFETKDDYGWYNYSLSMPLAFMDDEDDDD